MKKIILLFLIGALTVNSYAQSNSLTAGIGLLNAKVRVQFEHGFAYMHSTGVNLGYYLENWTGPRAEAFYRIYFGGDNEKGVFMQASAGAGMFSYALDDENLTFTVNSVEYNTYTDANSWTTLGGGIALGGKMTSRGGFVFESSMGFQLWTEPPSNSSDDYNDYGGDFLDAVETVGYYVVGPGFPLHFQVKFGYNF